MFKCNVGKLKRITCGPRPVLVSEQICISQYSWRKPKNHHLIGSVNDTSSQSDFFVRRISRFDVPSASLIPGRRASQSFGRHLYFITRRYRTVTSCGHKASCYVYECFEAPHDTMALQLFSALIDGFAAHADAITIGLRFKLN